VDGDLVDLAAIPSNKVNVADIAHVLSQINRFNGRTPRPYSVAQHSVFVSMLAGGRASRFPRLWHDGGEAFTGDIISPIKRVSGCSVHEVLALVDDAIVDNIPGLTDELGDSLFESYETEIKAADTEAYFFETHILQGRPIPLPGPERYGEFRNLADIKRFLRPMHPRAAEELFLARHAELTPDRVSPILFPIREE
jgi:hypothetical protein